MVTWTAELSPYFFLYATVAFVLLIVAIFSVPSEKPLTSLTSLLLLAGAMVVVFTRPGAYQVTGELEAVEAKVVAVDSNKISTLSNGTELRGSYELGETLQLLCVPSTIECVYDNGDLDSIQEGLSKAISRRAFQMEGNPAWAGVGYIELVRQYEGN